MITVYIPDTFIPERSYALNTLLKHYCGVDIEIIPRAGGDYVLSWDTKSIRIKDHFFGKIPEGETYLSARLIPTDIISTQSLGLDQILLLYGDEHLEITRDHIVCHVDLIAGAFFMLTRWEEAVIKEKDLHGRFPASSALSVKSGYILRPIVDEYSALLRYWLLTLGYPVPPDRSTFEVVPTCDVDKPYYWRSASALKILTGRLRNKMNPFHLIRDIRTMNEVKSGKKKDPFDTFDELMDLAELHHHAIRFYMMGGGKTNFEGFYQISDPHIKSLMAKMTARGYDIGVHPSYLSFDDPVIIKQEKEAVSSNSNTEIIASRQHYLRFDVPATWGNLEKAGIKNDSTMGYAAEPGFRCGTSKPFPVFDILERKELALIEQPLLIMDVSYRFYKNYSVEQSIHESQKIIDQVIKHNGQLVFLWHNSSCSEIDEWTGWDKMLRFLMEQ